MSRILLAEMHKKQWLHRSLWTTIRVRGTTKAFSTWQPNPSMVGSLRCIAPCPFYHVVAWLYDLDVHQVGPHSPLASLAKKTKMDKPTMKNPYHLTMQLAKIHTGLACYLISYMDLQCQCTSSSSSSFFFPQIECLCTLLLVSRSWSVEGIGWGGGHTSFCKDRPAGCPLPTLSVYMCGVLMVRWSVTSGNDRV